MAVADASVLDPKISMCTDTFTPVCDGREFGP